MDRFLLDTNMLLGFTRRAAWAQWAYETYDLWIAATAVATGAKLITTDKDFDHLDGIWLDRIFVSQSAKLS